MLVRKAIQKDGESITAKSKWATHYIPPRSLIICTGWFSALTTVITIDYFHPFVGNHGNAYLLVWVLGTTITLLINLYVERLKLIKKIGQQKANLHGLKHQYKLDQKEIHQLNDSNNSLNQIITIRTLQVKALSEQLPPQTAQYIQNEIFMQQQTREVQNNVRI